MAMDGVERSRLRDDNAQMKENYRRKEAELKKQHARQIKQLQNANANNMKKLRDNTQKALDSQRQRTNEALNDRDIKYQKQIRNLQEMNRERMREFGQRSDERVTSLQDRHNAEVKRLKQTSDQNFERMKSGLESELKTKEENQNEYAERIRAEQNEGLARERHELTRAHKKRESEMLHNHREKVGSLESRYSNEKALRQKENKDHQVERIETRQKNSENLLAAVQTERLEHKAMAENKDAKYQQSFDNLSADLAKTQAKQAKQYKDSMEQVRGDIYGRANRRESTLERKLTEEKIGRQSDMVKLNRLNSLKEDNLKRNLGAQIDKLEENREILVEESNRQNAGNIEDIRKKYDKQFHGQDQFYRDKINTMETIHDRTFKGEVGRLTARAESTETRANERIEKMDRMYEKYKTDTKNYYEGQLASAKNSYLENLSELRNSKDQERFDLETRLKTTMRERDVVAEKKLATETRKYESQIEILKDEHQRETRRLTENNKKIMKAIQKGHENDMRSKELEMKERLEQQKVAYERKIENMENNFEAQKAEWARIQRS